MSLSITSHRGCKTIKIGHDFDAAFVSENRSVIESSIEGDNQEFQVDLSSCGFIDSSGIGTLVFLFKRLVASGRTMRLSGLSGQPLDLITFLRIDQVIDIDRVAAPVSAPVFATPVLRGA